MSSCLWRHLCVCWRQREVVKSSHSIKGGKNSQDNPASTCYPDTLCPLLERLRVGLCCVRCRNIRRHTESPCQGAARAPASLPPLVSACCSHKHCFQLGSCLCCHFKMYFGMLTSASCNDFLFAPLLRGFINIELHRKQILPLSDCSVVTFLFLKSIMVNFISAQSFVSY